MLYPFMCCPIALHLNLGKLEKTVDELDLVDLTHEFTFDSR